MESLIETNIHPTAIVENGVEIGVGVVVEPYAVIKNGVKLGDGVIVKSHAYIEGNTTIESGTTIYPFASIGAKTQDKKFRGERTFVHIGKNCEIRECVTINSSCEENSVVRIGNDCLLMAYCHVAHNCEVGNGVIMSNNATLAGHVIVEDYAIIGGLTPIHQFVRIGRYAMVGGLSRVTHDVPPYTIGASVPYKMGGLNIIGLKRHGFSLETRRELAKAFNLTYRSPYSFEESLNKIEKEVKLIPEVKYWLEFCRQSKRGLIALQMEVSELYGLEE